MRTLSTAFEKQALEFAEEVVQTKRWIMKKTAMKNTAGYTARLALSAGLAGVLFSLVSASAMAQRGAVQPAAHAGQEPVNHLPNPYETQRNFGTLPDGRNWGSVSAVNIDIDGVHVWAGDRCGTNSCATSDVDPMVKLDPTGRVVDSLGAGQIIWPHGMDIDADGNIWTVAGTGEAGSTDEGEQASRSMLNTPFGVAYDEAKHTLYIADSFNHRTMKVFLGHE